MLYSYIAVASIFLRFGLLVSSSSSFCFAFNSKLSVLILCGCVIEPATSFRYTICYFVFSSFSCCCLPTWHCFFVFFLIRLIHCVCVFSGHTIHYVYFPSFVIDPILDRSSTGWCVLMALSISPSFSVYVYRVVVVYVCVDIYGFMVFAVLFWCFCFLES